MLEVEIEAAAMSREKRFIFYRYILALLRHETGAAKNGEHEIVLDVAEMARIEEVSMRDCRKRNFDPRWGFVGAVFMDAVSVVVNHPIRTSDGTLRIWKAVYWWNGLKGKSVALVPYTDDGRVLMVPAWRGPVVSRWELEFPGGGNEKATEDVQAVRGELFEEAGYEMRDFQRLGGENHFIVDPSTNGTPIALYAVRLGAKVGQRPEQGELFGKPMLLDRAQLEAAFREGYVAAPGDPLERRLHVLDGRNGICALMAIIHGLVR